MSAKDQPESAAGFPAIFPQWFDRWQTKYMNPVVKRVARFLPGTSIIKHRGRKSGKPYETVVTTYRKGNVLAIALGHGKTQWVQNVLAAGEADVHVSRRDLHITNPRILPPGTAGDELPWLAKVQGRRLAVFVADIA